MALVGSVARQRWEHHVDVRSNRRTTNTDSLLWAGGGLRRGGEKFSKRATTTIVTRVHGLLAITPFYGLGHALDVVDPGVECRGISQSVSPSSGTRNGSPGPLDQLECPRRRPLQLDHARQRRKARTRYTHRPDMVYSSAPLWIGCFQVSTWLSAMRYSMDRVATWSRGESGPAL